jgi:hypothetical protein
MRQQLYGLRLGEYDERFRNQNGCCDICKQPSERTLHVDHDHVTGKVRGLLCAACNFGLGAFRDSVLDLRRAIEYLTKI